MATALSDSQPTTPGNGSPASGLPHGSAPVEGARVDVLGAEPGAAPARSVELSEEREALHKVPQPTIERLSAYLQCVRSLRLADVETASSTQISQGTGINAAQFRKDLSYFGEFGTPGLGYDVVELEAHLSRIMGIDQRHDVLLVGAGNLGSALLHYSGFPMRGFRIVAAFDVTPGKVGEEINGVHVHHIDELARLNATLGATVGVVAVTREAAQEVVDKLVAAGVQAILNFAPVSILVRPGIVVRHVDLTSQMEVLSYYLRAR